MRNKNFIRVIAVAALAAAPLVIPSISAAQAPPTPPPPPIMPPSLPPSHAVDLMTAAGSATFGAQWRVGDVKIVEVPAIPNAMPQYKTTYNIEPRAGDSEFDDSTWPVIEAKDLAARRSGGHVAFIWYRANLTIPAKIGEFDPSGAVAVLTVLVDDYAEVWVNGQMPRRSGYPSPATILGSCSGLRSRRATSFKSRFSASTGRSRWRQPTRSGSARQSWNSINSLHVPFTLLQHLPIRI